jgi:hypothetical protein
MIFYLGRLRAGAEWGWLPMFVAGVIIRREASMRTL